MKSFTVITALLLCSLSWISVSESESQTVNVHPGEEVTLMCSNFSSVASEIIWFRVVERSELQCVASLFQSLQSAFYCDGFKTGKFEMTSNVSTVFLKIKPVNLSDSGLYFCGFYMFRNYSVIVQTTHLEVQEAIQESNNLMSVILGALMVFLVLVVIYLVVEIKRLQKVAHVEEQKPHETQRQSSDDVNYAAVTFHRRTERHYICSSNRELDIDIIYSAPGTAEENGADA